MIKISKTTVKDIEETDDLKWFPLKKESDNYELFDEICDFYGVERGDLCNSNLQFQWNKNTNDFCYSIVVNELDSWGIELDELTLYINKNHLSSGELEYIFNS